LKNVKSKLLQGDEKEQKIIQQEQKVMKKKAELEERRR